MKNQNVKAALLLVAALLLPIVIFFKEQIINMVKNVVTNPAKTIYDTAIQQGLSPTLAKLVVAQAKHETGNFTSNVFAKNNNAFGYKYVGQKIAINGTMSPEGNQYAKYSSLQDSVSDVAGWYKRRMTTFSAIKEGDTLAFANALKTYGYYTNSVTEYATGLRNFYTDKIA